MFVIDDTTHPSKLFPVGRHRGLDLRDRPNRDSYGYGDSATAFPSSLLIPRGEWQARIEEMEQQKSRISDMLRLNNIPVKDQGQVNYCWCFGPTRAVEIIRMVQGMPFVSLSPASVGGPITGYKNEGGWGKTALDYMLEHGLVPSSMWADQGWDQRQCDNAETRAERMKYRPLEWWEAKPRNLDQLMSLLLRRIPVAVGYDWWGHEVCLVDPVWENGGPAGRIENSWGESYGDKGFAVLAGSKLLPDDAVAPRTVMGM